MKTYLSHSIIFNLTDIDGQDILFEIDSRNLLVDHNYLKMSKYLDEVGCHIAIFPTGTNSNLNIDQDMWYVGSDLMEPYYTVFDMEKPEDLEGPQKHLRVGFALKNPSNIVGKKSYGKDEEPSF